MVTEVQNEYENTIRHKYRGSNQLSRGRLEENGNYYKTRTDVKWSLVDRDGRMQHIRNKEKW